MAKQTFTTGQVLTAAQMTSLQQTAMGGGSTTAKTTSYTLTAADAGTVVQMNAAGATTITVNTALFAAGDTVQIQNIGAGVCTVTAGTATVSTAGSLALSQYEGGQLYFNSASAAIFFDVVQASSAPAFSGAQARNTTLQNITNNTETAVIFDTEMFDSGSYWATGNNTRFTVPSTGKYSISVNMLFNYNPAANVTAKIYKNGSFLYQNDRLSFSSPSNCNGAYIGRTSLVDLTANDYVEIFVNQNSGGTQAIQGNNSETGSMQWSITYLGA